MKRKESIPLGNDIKDLLKQYSDLLKEISLLKDKINELQHDKVYGSDSEFPFLARSFNITGVSAERYENYNRMLKKACDMQKEALEWIEKIPDSRTRLVFIYRYVDTLSWKEIGRRMNFSESYVRLMIHDKYINKEID